MSPLPQWTYPEVLDRLEALKEYLIKLRVQFIPDLLCQRIANINELERARHENRLKDLTTSHRAAKLVWSVVEGWQWATIFEGIRDYDPRIIKRLMLNALKGPLHPIDETDNTNLGRNAVFELVLGAQFQRAGAGVTMGQEADLQIDHSGARLYVECKRPLSMRNIPHNITKARRQLQRRFKTDQRSNGVGGLVAISVSKALNPGLNMFVVDEEEELKQLGDDIERIHQRYNNDYDRQMDLRLVGMFYHLFTPAYVRSTGHLICASESRIFAVNHSFQTVFPLSGESLKQLLQTL